MKKRGCLGAMMTWVVSAGAVYLTAWLLPGMSVNGFGRAMLVALVIGLLNAVVRPVLVLLTLPVTVLSLGLFLVVINAVLLEAAAWMLDGFNIDGFWTAALASLVLSIATAVLDAIVFSGKDK